MTPDPVPPWFLSVEFHTRFFPSLLWHNLRPKKKDGTTFTFTTEQMIILAVCLIMSLAGARSAFVQGTVFGWVIVLVGLGGMAAIVLSSIAGQWGTRPTYDHLKIR